MRRHRRSSGHGSAAASTVVLHVGAPKTGTTFLQQVLWHNRERLAARGVQYPFNAPRDHFAATMDLREAAWGGQRDPAWDGAWDRLARRVLDGQATTAIVSNELLGAATDDQVKRAIASFQPAQVEVVFTARDLARQLPSEWQEQVRHNKTATLDEMLDQLVALSDVAELPPEAMFWRLHDPVRVLRPWADVVGADHVHVVTVPPPGAPPELLWHRFAEAAGIDPADVDLDVHAAHASLGLVEAELLRRTNARMEDAGVRPHPAQRRRLVRRVLGEHSGRRRIVFPPRHADWARTRTAELVAGVQAAGYHVVGDLADLEPRPATAPAEPNDVTDRELLEVALDALAGLLAHPGPSDAEASSNRGSQ